MTVKNATELLQLIENTLGWTPNVTETTPRWRAVANMAGRINKKVKTNPQLYTWENLELAVNFLWKARQAVYSPMLVFSVVEQAVAEKHHEPPRPLGVQVEDALRLEYEIDDAQSHLWISRLSRAFGTYRADVLAEWRAARR